MSGFGYSEIGTEEYIYSSVSVAAPSASRISTVSTPKIRYYTLSGRLLSEKQVLSYFQPVIAVTVDENETKRRIVNLNELRGW